MQHVKKNNVTIVDLFAGAGGLGEGFAQAGFNLICSIDADYHCVLTLKNRAVYRILIEREQTELYFDYLKNGRNIEKFLNQHKDIEKSISGKILLEELKPDNIGRFVKYVKEISNNQQLGIIGGPPCQAYSLVGRSRDKYRKINDARHFLFKVYLDIIRGLQPVFFLYENVPGLVTARSYNGIISELFTNDFKKLDPPYILLHKRSRELMFDIANDTFNFRDHIIDMAEYGIPQNRRRVILVGVRRDIYESNTESFDLFWNKFEKNKKTSITVGKAISDLPELKPGEGNDRFYDKKYKQGRPNYYVSRMKKNTLGILNHKARNHMKSDLDRYRYFIKKTTESGRSPNLNDLQLDRPDLMPNHNNINSFIDRFKVQRSDNPASTITAHIAKDGHYYIHPEQVRSLTVREAARLQSFPDNFFFEGPRTEQFKQVGNAVPPLFAKVLAEIIKNSLEELVL